MNSVALEVAKANDAFARALAALTPSLRVHLRGQLGTADAVDDVVQESCLRMLRYRDTVSGDDLRSLLYRVAANVVADRFRRAQSQHAPDHYPLDSVELPANERQSFDWQ